MSSTLQRTNPAIKLLAMLVITACLTSVFDPCTPAMFLVAVLAAGWLLGGLTPAAIMRTLLPILVAVAGIMLANILFNRLNGAIEPLVTIGPVRITRPALVTGASLSLRMLCFAAVSVVFVRTTDATDLILSLIHQCRLHYRLAYGMMVGYRMLPLLQGEYSTIRAAHRIRGVHEREGALATWSRVKRYSVPLLAGSVRRAGRVALAMDARGFGAFPDRTYRRRPRVVAHDWRFLAGTVAAAALIVALSLGLGLLRFGVGT